VAKKKVYLSILAIFVFIAYTILAAQPVPAEIILTNKWVKALDSITAEEEPVPGAKALIPFMLGNRFGYVDSDGRLFLNQEREKIVSFSPEYWAEYDPAPEELVIHDPLSDLEITLEKPGGYPVFMDGRILLISKDQTSLKELNRDGEVLWQYDYEAPVTSLDAAGGYVITGTLDGMIDLLKRDGSLFFSSYAPGASRIPVILGCRISSDGSRIAVVSGIDKQRFLFSELYGNTNYRVTYHEFLKGEGYRREVFMSFVGNNTQVVFEQESGLGVYDVQTRTTITLPIAGRMESQFQARLEAMDEEGGDGLFFYVSSGSGRGEKRFVVLKLPGTELLNVPFKSEVSFLTRRGNELFIGGGMTLASFTIDRR